MELTPFNTCLRPKKVFVRSLNSFEYVPCGKCEACINRKNNELAYRVECESKAHQYSYFFTLTYDNDHLPTASIHLSKTGHYEIMPMNISSRFSSYHPFMDHFSPKSDLFDGVLPKVLKTIQKGKKKVFVDDPMFSDNTFGIVLKSDIQNFLKRFRYYVKKYIKSNPKIRYWIVSEYGPGTLRPHYHGLFFYDSAELNEKILNLIRLSWAYKLRLKGKGRNRFKNVPFCSPYRFQEPKYPGDRHATVGLVTAGAPHYVAKYVTCNSHLPMLLQTKFTCCFRLSSRGPAIGYLPNARKEVFYHFTKARRLLFTSRDNGSNCFLHQCYKWNAQDQSNVIVNIPYSKGLLDSTFFKCYRYREISSYSKYLTYSFIVRNEERYLNVGRYGFLHLHEYNYLEMDKDANWQAAVRCYKFCKLTGCSVTEYLDTLNFYLRRKAMYTLKTFFELQHQYYKIYRDPRILAAAYPDIFACLPEVLKPYYPFERSQFTPLIRKLDDLGFNLSDFYPDGVNLDKSFVYKYKDQYTDVYSLYYRRQVQRYRDNCKTKLKNNTSSDMLNSKID